MASHTAHRAPKLRVEIVAVEIVLMGAVISALALSDLVALVPLFAFPALFVQSVLFYKIGRVREQLER
ncbi:MAG: hypothetical protein HYS09_09590 [Chloroflexi bacterium]|nr:hypothetical protein [Chloroflexota bacterium]